MLTFVYHAGRYLRMSDGRQERSIAGQRTELLACTKKHGYKILREEALALLQEELDQPMTLTRPEPDIAQIGSTWRAHFSP